MHMDSFIYITKYSDRKAIVTLPCSKCTGLLLGFCVAKFVAQSNQVLLNHLTYLRETQEEANESQYFFLKQDYNKHPMDRELLKDCLGVFKTKLM